MSENLSREEHEELERLSKSTAFLHRAYAVLTEPTLDIRNKEGARKKNKLRNELKKFLKIKD